MSEVEAQQYILFSNSASAELVGFPKYKIMDIWESLWDASTLGNLPPEESVPT